MIDARSIAATYQLPFHPPFYALHDVSLQVQPGEIVGVLGRNGAGKTTLLKVLLGLIHPSQGQLQVLGYNPVNQRRWVLQNCGVILEGQRTFSPRWTPLDVFLYLGAQYGLSAREAKQRGLALLRRFRLEDQQNRVIMRFSRGMKQKLALCALLLHRPALLILDEPTIGLDVETTRELLTQITSIAREEGRAVVLTSHQLNLIERAAERVVVVHEGRSIFSGTPQQLVRQVGRGRVRLTFDHLPEPTGLDFPAGVEVDGDTLVIPADTEVMAQALQIATQCCWKLRNIEQMLDFEDAFLALTRKLPGEIS